MAAEAIAFSVLSLILGATGVFFGAGHWRERKRLARQALSWDYCFLVAEELCRKIGKWDPDLVIGIGRSGGIWGGWMAGNLGSKPLAVVDDNYRSDDVSFPAGSLVLNAMKTTYPSARKVLVIEGASSRGTTIRRFRAEFREELSRWEVRFAVLFAANTSDAEIAFVGKEGPEHWPDEMPWHVQKGWIRAMKRGDS